MCQRSCAWLDASTLTDFLTTIKTWLNSNVDEVVTVLLTNPDSFPISKFGEALVASRLSTYAYAPNKTVSVDE